MQQHLMIRMERRSTQAVVLETYPTRRQALQRKRKLCSSSGVVLVLSGQKWQQLQVGDSIEKRNIKYEDYA